jgi:hypothetical protein
MHNADDGDIIVAFSDLTPYGCIVWRVFQSILTTSGDRGERLRRDTFYLDLKTLKKKI